MASKKASYLSEEYRNSLGKLLELTSEQLDRLKKKIHKEITDWKEATSGRVDRLQRWNDLVEGVVEETDYPFDGASNLHVPLILIYLKVYHTIFRRSILGSGTLWYLETEDDSLEESLPDIDQNLNYKAFAKWNIAETINEVLWVTPRDSVGAIEVDWVEEYEENVKDFVLIENQEQFLEEFPPEQTDMPEDEWQSWLQQASEATEDSPIEIPITYDKEIYKGSKGEVVEYANFVTFPATAKTISKSDARGYGKRFYMRLGEIRARRDEGIWYKEASNRLLQKCKQNSKVTNYISSKDFIEGVQRQGSDEQELFKLIYRFRLEKNGTEQKLMLIYSYDYKEFLMIIDYPYRVDNYAVFKIGIKPGRQEGRSIVGDNEDGNEEVDALHNQRINSRKITEVPSFKGKASAKKDFDAGSQDNRWRPGVIFWLEDPETFTQFVVQPVDLRSSLEEEINTSRLISMNAGVEPSIFSGSAQREDPNAPGIKTAMLIQQSNLRMDDALSELRNGIEAVGRICLSHEYQFGSSRLQFMSEENGKQVSKTISKRLLRKGINVRMHGVDVIMNPETEFKKWMTYTQTLMQQPIIANRVKSIWHLLNNTMRYGRVKDRNKILPTLEELQKEDEEMKFKIAQRQQQELIQKTIESGEKAKKEVLNQTKQNKQLQTMSALPSTGNGNGNNQTI